VNAVGKVSEFKALDEEQPDSKSGAAKKGNGAGGAEEESNGAGSAGKESGAADAAAQAADEDAELAQILKDAKRRLKSGDVPAAERMLLEVVQRTPDTMKAASAFLELGTIYHRQARYSDADNAYHKALTIIAKSGSTDGAARSTVMNNLGLLYAEQGKLDKAEPMLNQALKARRADGARQDNTAVAVSLMSLADVQLQKHNFKECEDSYSMAIQMLTRSRPGSVELAKALNNSANVYYATKAYSKAESQYRQAIELKEHAGLQRDADLAISYNNLANIEQRQDKFDQASKHYSQALSIYEGSIGTMNPHYAKSLNNLGQLLRRQAKPKEAEAKFRQALVIDERVLGPDHPYVGSILSNLAACLRSDHRGSEAKPLQARAREIAAKSKTALAN
jgi:tetratricopeptide (TPR) repeat protein